MAEKSTLDRIISYVGILTSVFGILLVVYLFTVFGSFIDAFHQSAVSQADSAISILTDAKLIVSSTADSIDSFSSMARNASTALDQSAYAMDGMGDAVNSLAVSLGAIPYMPAEAINPLRSSATAMKGTGESIRDTAASMENISGTSLSTAAGVQSLEEDIDANIISLEATKRQIDDMQATARLGLFLASALVALTFLLNGLNFYRQLK